MQDFLEGLVVGLILQVSVGPVCIAVLHKALTQGFSHAFSMAWGAVLVDAFYIVLSLLGVSALLQIEAAQQFVGLLGALLLVFFGIRYLRAPAPSQPIDAGSSTLFKSFTYGVGLTLTNPLTILFWVGVLGVTISSHTFEHPHGIAIFAAGCVSATLLFLTAVALAGHLLEPLLSDRVWLWLNRAVGLFLIAFSVKLLVDLF